MGELSQCKEVLTQLVAELKKPEPLFWVVYQLLDQVGAHNNRQAEALLGVAEAFEEAAKVAEHEGNPNAKLKSESGVSNIVKLREV